MSIEKVLDSINKIVGDNPLIIHSDIGQILKKYPVLLSKGRESFFQNFTSLLRKKLSSRFVFVPTFNYKFCKLYNYDIYNSPSELGAFSEYARKNFPNYRTLVPVFNHVDIKENHDVNGSQYCIDLAFGNKSFYDWFTELDGYVLFWGCEASKSNTYLHHIEKIAGVNYRYEKIFTGFIKKRNFSKKIDFTYFIRNESYTVDYFDQGIGFLKKSSCLFNLDNNFLEMYSAKKALGLISKKLNDNKFSLITIDSCKEIAKYLHDEQNLTRLDNKNYQISILSDINMELLTRSWKSKQFNFKSIYSADIILGIQDFYNKAICKDDVLIILLSFRSLKVGEWNQINLTSNKLKPLFEKQADLIINQSKYLQKIYPKLRVILFSPFPTTSLKNITTSYFEEILLKKELINFDERMSLGLSSFGIDYIPFPQDYFDYESFLSDINYLRYGYPFNFKNNIYLRREIINKVINNLSISNTIKAISIDLDDTLWKGIAGDGEASISNDYPFNAHLLLQSTLKKLKNAGIFLIATTKNEKRTVDETFKQLKKYMYLQINDFSSIQASWESKSNSIRNAAIELNISTDSILHIDDSIFEIEEIRSSLPLTEVIKFDVDSIGLIVNKIMNHPRIKKNQNVSAKLNRNKQLNTSLMISKKSLNDSTSKDYLKSLCINISLISHSIEPNSKSRIYELFNKTNQFNTSQLRFTRGEIEAFSEKNLVFAITYNDNSSSQEIPSAIVIEFDQEGNLIIKAFVLSCRFFSRGLEYFFLNTLIKSFNLKKVYINLRCSAKNKPCFRFVNQITDEKIQTYEEIPNGINFKIKVNKKKLSLLSDSFEEIYQNE